MKITKPRVLNAVRTTCQSLPSGQWFPARSILIRAHEKPLGQHLTMYSIPSMLKHLVNEGLMERRPIKEQRLPNGGVRFHWEYRLKESD